MEISCEYWFHLLFCSNCFGFFLFALFGFKAILIWFKTNWKNNCTIYCVPCICSLCRIFPFIFVSFYYFAVFFALYPSLLLFLFVSCYVFVISFFLMPWHIRQCTSRTVHQFHHIQAHSFRI